MLRTRPLLKALPVLLSLLAVSLAARDAHAQVALGGRLAAIGPVIAVNILPSDAAYTSDIWLFHAGTVRYLGTNQNPGGPLLLLTRPGAELVFAIHVRETGDVFYMGPSYRNPDSLAHAAVAYDTAVSATIGFEDLFGGGDLDCNDVMLRVYGATAS